MIQTISNLEQLLAVISSPGFHRAVFAGIPQLKPQTPWKRITIRPITIRGELVYQFEYFSDQQAFAKNESSLDEALRELWSIGYANTHIRLGNEELELRRSKKGKLHLQRRPAKTSDTTLTHNRSKEHPLPEGQPNSLLETMGICTPDGRVRASLRGKFTQINEFLKLLDHALEPSGLLKLERPLTILDCGCGSSYLTLAVHHYLSAIRHVPATVLGVDINESVIRKSMQKAEILGAKGLSFACGTIGSIDTRADLVIALHACDTATDDALAQAVRSEARLILCVPCCHRHLNRQLKPIGPSSVLRPVLRHGILSERTADIITDAFRALALRILGYRVDVVEFVNLEHTARNVLIRAVRIEQTEPAPFIQEYQDLKRFLNVEPYIETALRNVGRSDWSNQ